MQSQGIPNYAHKIIVPIANPTTAPILLNLAVALAHPNDGKVIAVTVSMGDSESTSKSLKQLQPVLDVLQEEHGDRIEHFPVRATGIARGILDAVRERGADLLILGVQKPIQGQVVLGTIAENVAETAPCDVLIYRSGQTDDFKRVAFWANGSEAARVASYVGILLSQNRLCDLEAMYIQRNDRSYWQALARIEQTITEIPGNQSVKRTVIEAQDLVGGLLKNVTKDDLFIVGFSRRSELEKWLYADFARELLNRVPGPVILTSRAAGKDLRVDNRFRQRLRQWTPTLTRSEQDDIVRQADDMAESSLDYMVLITISAALASFGLLLNSAAVIIGAMLVAPLMQPLIGLAVGLATGRVPLIQKGVFTVMTGIAAALGVSVLFGYLIPTDTPTTEMLGRGTPTLIDVGVALASGLVGGYATARKDIPAALAGVAIAAALVPPLCTVGLGFAFGDMDLAVGSMLLFLMNISYISFASLLVFLWLGIRPRRTTTQKGEAGNQHRVYVSAAAALVLFLPLAIIGRNLSQQAIDSRAIERSLDESFDSGEIINVEIENENPIHVIATLRDIIAPTKDDLERAEQALETELEEDVALDIVYMQLLSFDTKEEGE